MTLQETATILAALRFWQANPEVKAGCFRDISTGLGAFAPLGNKEIDSLCERINTRDDLPEAEPNEGGR